MKPVKVLETNKIFKLSGGTSENDLPVESTIIDGQVVLISTWELEDHEREAIRNGATIKLIVWGSQHPPVGIGIGESIESGNNGI